MNSRLVEDSLKLKAAIEFGSEYMYTIKNGGLGPTLYVAASGKQDASIARKKIPGEWEGLYVVVTYCTADDDDDLYDPTLT